MASVTFGPLMRSLCNEEFPDYHVSIICILVEAKADVCARIEHFTGIKIVVLWANRLFTRNVSFALSNILEDPNTMN